MTHDGTTVSTPYKIVSSNPVYDNNGTLTAITNNRFHISWVYATNDINNSIYTVLGQADYSSLANAQAATLPSILVNTAEWKLIYKVTFKNTGGTPTWQETIDYRNTSSTPVVYSGGVSSMSALNVVTDTTNFNGILSLSNTTVQSALDTIDDHTHTL